MTQFENYEKINRRNLSNWSDRSPICIGKQLASEDHMNGIHTAEIIASLSSETKLVFVSGHADYALKSFSAHPYDYIMKPINTDKLINTITKLLTQASSHHPPSKKIRFRIKNSVIFVDEDHIQFIEKKAEPYFYTVRKQYIPCRVVSMTWNPGCRNNLLDVTSLI